MYSSQEALARDPMREQEEQARPTHLLPAAAEGPRIGDAASRTRTVTARDIELFTEITGARNPLHYNPSWPAAPASAASSCRAGSPAACSTP
jgi:acyl dehydratase